jgi:hypothetical protein
MANKPNNPSLWSKAKSLAKQKFDVYPSAYANGWAAKYYKSKGGTWRKAEYGMEVMNDMAEGGEKMPPEIARARFAAAGNLDQMSNYGYAFGGYIPEMMYGGYDYMQQGGEPNGGMALGQMSAVADKMSKLREFVSPEQNLDPWIASKLAVMDDSADAIADYMMYNPEAQGEEQEMMEGGGYVVTRSSDRKGKTHKVTGPDGSVKYFGDSKMGQHPGDPERKAAFYARHKSNLEGNPHFRAFARETWETGGSTFSGNAFYENGGFIPTYNVGGMYGYGGGLDRYQYAGPVSLSPELSMDPYATYEEQAEPAPLPEWHREWEEDPYADAGQPMMSEDEQVAAMDQQNVMATDPGVNYDMSGVVPQSAVSPTKQSAPRSRSNGVSIVDYLNSRDLPSDYNSRKAMAEQMGITNYRGTADQNLDMLARLSQGEQAQAAGAVTPPPPDAGGNSGGAVVYDPQTGSWIPTAVTLGAAGAGVGGLTYYVSRQAWKDGSSAAGAGKTVKTALQGLGKDDMVKAIKDRGYRLGTDYDDLVKAGWKPNEIMQKLKGIPFKDTKVKQQAAAYKNVVDNNLLQKRSISSMAEQNLSTFGEDLKAAKKAYNARFKNAQPIIDEIANRGTRSANDLARLRQAGLTQQEAQAALKGFKFGTAASEARGFGQAVREGYAALRSAPALGRVAQAAKAVGKYLPFEEGGELYMQEGGWNVGGYQVPDWLKTSVQVMDPTGVSSYGDVYDAWRNPNVPAWQAGLETLSALPVVGKIGKAAKATSKLGKMMDKADVAMKYVSPVAYMDRKLAPNAAFANMMANRAAGKAGITQGMMQMGSLSNQGRRFYTGAEAGVGAMDNMMGYTPQKANGGMVGQEMDVTPEELEMLKAQGYQFEII